MAGSEFDQDKVKQLDRDYSDVATGIVLDASKAAAGDRLAVLTKVEEYRKEMTDRAMNEAANPLREAGQPLILRLGGTRQVSAPAEPSRSISIAQTTALSAPPDASTRLTAFEKSRMRELIVEQAKIWLALRGRTLVTAHRAGVSDVTEEFESWRRRQLAGR